MACQPVWSLTHMHRGVGVERGRVDAHGVHGGGQGQQQQGEGEGEGEEEEEGGQDEEVVTVAAAAAVAVATRLVLLASLLRASLLIGVRWPMGAASGVWAVNRFGCAVVGALNELVCQMRCNNTSFGKHRTPLPVRCVAGPFEKEL